MIRVAIVLALVGCESRSVSIKADNIEVAVDTSDRLNHGTAEVSVIVNARPLVPLVLVPVPVPYARACALAEKP